MKSNDRISELVQVIGAFKDARSKLERRVIARAANLIITEIKQPQKQDGRLSVTARRMLQALGDQELHTKTWAMATRRGMSHTSGTFCEALKELLAAGAVTKIRKGVYRINPDFRESAEILSMQVVSP